MADLRRPTRRSRATAARLPTWGAGRGRFEAMPTLRCTALAAQALALEALPVIGQEADAEPEDDLAALDDDFSGADDLEGRGWLLYRSETLATQAVSDGEVVLESTTGGNGGVWWYAQPGFRQNGSAVYKLVTGDFDARARVRQRNAAGSGSPTGGVPLEWRMAGMGVFDPAGFVSGYHSFAYIALGGSPNGANRAEWKVHDDDGGASPQSTFDDEEVDDPLDYDLRTVKVGQLVELSYRPVSSGEPLESDLGWTELITIEKDTNDPPRTGGATPVPFPEEVAVAIIPPYAGPQTDLDQHFTVEAFRIRRPS